MPLYPHTATAWIKDDTERTATWERVLITGCRFTQTRGATPSTQGDASARTSTILMQSCTLKRGDRIIMGVYVEEQPPVGSLTISTVHPVYLDETPHHFEVEAS